MSNNLDPATMPNRYLRESYKESEAVNSVSWPAEVLWTRLIVTVDDWGRCEANPKLLRAKLFPLKLDSVRESDMSRLLAECEKAGLIRLYQSDNKEYLQMNKWERGRAEKSRYPNPPDKCKPLQTTANNGLRPSTDAPDCDSDSDNDPDISSEPGEPAAEPTPDPLLIFPCVGVVKSWELTEKKLAEWQETYPDMDVFAAVRQARQWTIDNPTKRKTVNGMTRFLGTWLNTAQNKGEHRRAAPTQEIAYWESPHPDAKRPQDELLREAFRENWGDNPAAAGILEKIEGMTNGGPAPL